MDIKNKKTKQQTTSIFFFKEMIVTMDGWNNVLLKRLDSF